MDSRLEIREGFTLRGLSYEVRGSKILENVSLAVPSQALTFVVGPNGSGKTTLLKILAGVSTPTSGILQGSGKCGYLPSHWPTGVDYKACEVVAMAKGYEQWDRKESLEEAREKLREFGIGELSEKNFYSLSSGQQQQVHLARVSLQDVRSWVLDEPTAFLDLKWIMWVGNFLQEKARRGICIVAAVHDLRMARKFGDFVVVMDQGKVVTAGEAREALRDEVVERVFGVTSIF